MISVPFAHVGGLPVEETLGAFGPALLVGFGVAWARLRAHLRSMRSNGRGLRPGPGREARLPFRVVAALWARVSGETCAVGPLDELDDEAVGIVDVSDADVFPSAGVVVEQHRR